MNPSATTQPDGSPTMTSELGDIAIILGTRPEIIKLAGIIRELGERARVIHTGQHWDDAMAGQFFTALGIGAPDVRLTGMKGVGRGHQIANALVELTDHFTLHRPAAVIVQGDTNSVSAGAQAANYLDIPVIHVEAGLRSHDRGMPEEINRLVAGTLADLHCAATELNARNLKAEGVDPDRILVTGNTVVEATQHALSATDRRPGRPWDRKQVLATIHRPENTDTAPALERILTDLDAIAGSGTEVTFCLHPRTAAAIKAFSLERLLARLDVRRGVGHQDFLELANQADLIISDSGGVQEEVTVLKKPLLVVRRSTERPEAIEAGFAELITPGASIRTAAQRILDHPTNNDHLVTIPSPYGTGEASTRIAEAARQIAARS